MIERKLVLIFAGVVCVIIIGLAVRIFFLEQSKVTLTAERDSFHSQFNEVSAANESQAVTLRTQKAELDRRDAAELTRQKAVEKAQADAKVWQDLAARRKHELDTRAAMDQASPECRAFLEQDIAKSCPNIAETVVDQAK